MALRQYMVSRQLFENIYPVFPFLLGFRQARVPEVLAWEGAAFVLCRYDYCLL